MRGPMKRFVLLDRDGTINVERNYLSEAREVELLPGSAAGLRRMRAAGLGLAVVTNQSGLARGYFSLEGLKRIHGRLNELLVAEGTHLDGIYFCPHLPDDECSCRKPRPGLVEQAAEDLGFVPEASYVVGDKICDVDLGRAVGATTILVRTGYGAKQELSEELKADYVADDLSHAAVIIEDLLERERTEAAHVEE
ncbi:MAG: D-glycero-beta-D-manno-heptose 1,7-bisphosphate 7-phosphatase [Deltaproteobacteria bacterium]|nr:D-glycero-beta-D-manno-heptose 1,7-bisphosphate 7-phosphatase [Deltaproteobacteria bacterium]